MCLKINFFFFSISFLNFSPPPPQVPLHLSGGCQCSAALTVSGCLADISVAIGSLAHNDKESAEGLLALCTKVKASVIETFYFYFLLDYLNYSVSKKQPRKLNKRKKMN